jgi:hypothetical protein
MVLFFILSLVAAYTSRNLIFEQRTSANQYRASQAFEAAEAGVEWALGLLNGGRIDAACLPTDDPAFEAFRQRYLQVTAAGTVAVRTWNDAGVLRPRSAACVRSPSGWSCDCPADGAPAPGLPAEEGSFPAFLVNFEAGPAPGQFRIRSTGCSAYDASCLSTRRGNANQAAATVIATAALAPAMPTSPAAALTVRGQVDLGSHPLRVANPDPATQGITVQAGGRINLPAALLETTPGALSGPSTMVEADPVLAGWTADRMFQSFFGVDRTTFGGHPATVVLTCGPDCSDTLAEAVSRNPGRARWIDGDLVLDQAVALGSPAQPLLLVVTGQFVMNAVDARLVGVVYSQASDWTGSGGGLVEGAVLAEGNLTGTSAMNVLYDAEAVARVRLAIGSMIRVPGGWRDF